MAATLVITFKDLRERLRDGSLFIWGLLAPLGLAFVLSMLFDFGGGGLSFSFAVVDEDGGDLGRRFTETVIADVQESGFAEFEFLDDSAAAVAGVEDGSQDAAIIVPEGFTEAVRDASPASMQVVGNIDAGIATQVARSLAEHFVGSVRSSQVAVGLAAQAGADPAGFGELAQLAASMPPPVSFELDAQPDRQLDATSYLAAGMAVFFLFFTVQFGVTGLLEERRLGTMQRLMAAPIPRWSVYGAKVLTSFLLGVASMTALVIGMTLLIGADFGDPLGVALLIVMGVIAASSIMAIVAVFAATPEQANNIQSIIAVVLGMVGGSFFPIGEGQVWLQWLSRLSPHHWFLRGIQNLAGPGGVSDIGTSLAALAAFAVAGFGISWFLARRQVRA